MSPHPRGTPRGVRLPVALATVLTLLAGFLAFTSAGTAGAAGTLLSQGRTATASSAENADTAAAKAVDGDAGTRWSSTFADPQWLQVDLGSTRSISQVVLNWEAAYASAFTLQTSDNGTTWTDVTGSTAGRAGVQTVDVTASGRYVRMNGTARATAYGYSLWEFQVYGGATPTCGSTNVAQGRTATATSAENADTAAAKAVDGNTATRWSSAFADPQSLTVDLGSVQAVCSVTLNWEAAYASAFTLQTSTDGANWTAATAVTAGRAGPQTLTLSANARYVRMSGTARATAYGYSLWEFQVFTTGGTTTPPVTTPVTTPPVTTPVTTPPVTTTGSPIPTSDTPDFGANVAIFDPSMSSASIQAKLDSVFAAQKANQFGERRDALLFKPGTYSNTANIGYYTSILGLGTSPDAVTINGDVTVDAFNDFEAGNATQNFWRSAENLAVVPSAGTDRWAVAQAAPFRRIHVRGGLNLYPASYGWASGGYIADTVVDGTVASASQQQWYSRDSTFGGWNGSNWNMVFSGVNGAPAQSFPNPPMTTLARTPVSREKPFLYIDGAGKYRVFVPSLRTNAAGPSWAGGTTAGSSLPMSQFFVARPSDGAAKINQALAQGLNLFFTPGVYHLNQTIDVTRADTVVLGIGLATLIPDNGVNAMTVADVDGVKLAGLLFDAGTTNTPTLLTVGGSGAARSHAANPTTIQDVFFRIGGAVAGKATTSLVVNSDDVIVDHIWAWRADHGSGIGWTTNTADTGLVVNGDNVLATGLFVEHYQKYEVVWNGQNGKTIFFQNEMPYDVPDQAAWNSSASRNGWAAYKVGDGVTSHEAWGLGSYCFFNVNPAVNAYHAFEVPNTSGVRMHDLLTVSLGNKGSITHVIDDTGAVTPTDSTRSNVTSYP
jgi:F5/8 type C domain